jgi:transposase
MVRRIRTLRRHGASYTELAAKFGVSYDTVRGVITGRTWKHI